MKKALCFLLLSLTSFTCFAWGVSEDSATLCIINKTNAIKKITKVVADPQTWLNGYGPDTMQGWTVMPGGQQCWNSWDETLLGIHNDDFPWFNITFDNGNSFQTLVLDNHNSHMWGIQQNSGAGNQGTLKVGTTPSSFVTSSGASVQTGDTFYDDPTNTEFTRFYINN